MEDPHPISPLNLNNSNHHPLSDIQSLREELAKINAELVQASEERAQAAEYGLVILEEKQNLQIQLEELSSLYESTKRELENSTDVSELFGFIYYVGGGVWRKEGGKEECVHAYRRKGEERERERVSSALLIDDLFQLETWVATFTACPSSQSLIHQYILYACPGYAEEHNDDHIHSNFQEIFVCTTLA